MPPGTPLMITFAFGGVDSTRSRPTGLSSACTVTDLAGLDAHLLLELLEALEPHDDGVVAGADAFFLRHLADVRAVDEHLGLGRHRHDLRARPARPTPTR